MPKWNQMPDGGDWYKPPSTTQPGSASAADFRLANERSMRPPSKPARSSGSANAVEHRLEQKPSPSKPKTNSISIQSGDSLWGIAQKKLGDGNRWKELRKADGKPFTEKDASRLGVGTQVYLPQAKPKSVSRPSSTNDANRQRQQLLNRLPPEDRNLASPKPFNEKPPQPQSPSSPSSTSSSPAAFRLKDREDTLQAQRGKAAFDKVQKEKQQAIARLPNLPYAALNEQARQAKIREIEQKAMHQDPYYRSYMTKQKAQTDAILAVREYKRKEQEARSHSQENKGGFLRRTVSFAKKHASDIVHTGLDAAGYIPVAGAVFDGANAVLYLAEGDKKNAALSAAAAIPGVGDAAAVTKLAIKGSKFIKNEKKAEEIVQGAKRIDEGLSRTQNAVNNFSATLDTYEAAKTGEYSGLPSLPGIGSRIHLPKGKPPNLSRRDTFASKTDGVSSTLNTSNTSQLKGRQGDRSGTSSTGSGIEHPTKPPKNRRGTNTESQKPPNNKQGDRGTIQPPGRLAIEAAPRRLAIKAAPSRPLYERGARLESGQRTMTKEQWNALDGERRATNNVRDLPGHGHQRHGSQTTLEQQKYRVQTGIAPDGTIAKKPPTRSTRFDSNRGEREAVARAQRKVETRPTIAVNSQGEAKLIRDPVHSIVDSSSGGYGRGFELHNGTVRPTGRDPRALGIQKYDWQTGQWNPVTQYPTNQAVTETGKRGDRVSIQPLVRKTKDEAYQIQEGDSVPGLKNATYGKPRGGGGSAKARDYDKLVTGSEWSIYIKRPEGLSGRPVEFDGVINHGLESTLLDAKASGSRRSWYDVTGTDKFTRNVKIPDILKQARLQLKVLPNSGASGIEWRAATRNESKSLQDLFDREQLDITVTHGPLSLSELEAVD